MRAASLFLFALACSRSEPVVEGKVVDIWGHPIEGATVMVVGLDERPLTDKEGRYRLRRVEGAYAIKAGKAGYVQEHSEIDITAEGTEAPILTLYPKPEENGFYLVGTGAYSPVAPEVVSSKGTELERIRGITKLGDAVAEGAAPEVIFHTDLKLDEINRLGLELVQLQYIRDTELAGPLAATQVKVNLYTAQAEVPIELRPLRSRTDYLVTTKEPLKPGPYALQTQRLLSGTDADAFNQIPSELRVVFPFEVR